MNYLLYFFQIIIIQYTTAQMITLAGRNFIPNLNQNCNLPLAANFANNAGLLANIGQTNQLPNNIQLSTQDLINANMLNNNAYLTNNNIGLASNMAQDINANLINNAYVANANIGSSNMDYNANFNNAYGIAQDINANNVAYVSNSNIGSVPTENTICNNVPTYANVVQPPREYGIEFSSGALQVGGTVEVNGRVPFNTNVALSGSVPTQGVGNVNYSCDQISNDES